MNVDVVLKFLDVSKSYLLKLKLENYHVRTEQ